MLAQKLNAILEALKSDETWQAMAYHEAFVKHVNGVEIDGALLGTLALVRSKAGREHAWVYSCVICLVEPLDPEKIGGAATERPHDDDAGIDLDWNIELSTSGEGDIEWDISVDAEPQQGA